MGELNAPSAGDTSSLPVNIQSC